MKDANLEPWERELAADDSDFGAVSFDLYDDLFPAPADSSNPL